MLRGLGLDSVDGFKKIDTVLWLENLFGIAGWLIAVSIRYRILIDGMWGDAALMIIDKLSSIEFECLQHSAELRFQ